MQAFDFMTKNPACGQVDSTMREIARMMVEHDCGLIPIVDAENRPVGVITDRDISCRVVAQDLDPNRALARDHMTSPPVTVTMRDSLGHCCRTMEEYMIRRLPVVDDYMCCVGIIAQADIARKSEPDELTHVLKEISTPTAPSARTTS